MELLVFVVMEDEILERDRDRLADRPLADRTLRDDNGLKHPLLLLEPAIAELPVV